MSEFKFENRRNNVLNPEKLSVDELKAMRKRILFFVHPDRGGSEELVHEVNVACEKAEQGDMRDCVALYEKYVKNKSDEGEKDTHAVEEKQEFEFFQIYHFVEGHIEDFIDPQSETNTALIQELKTYLEQAEEGSKKWGVGFLGALEHLHTEIETFDRLDLWENTEARVTMISEIEEKIALVLHGESVDDENKKEEEEIALVVQEKNIMEVFLVSVFAKVIEVISAFTKKFLEKRIHIAPEFSEAPSPDERGSIEDEEELFDAQEGNQKEKTGGVPKDGGGGQQQAQAVIIGQDEEWSEDLLASPFIVMTDNVERKDIWQNMIHKGFMQGVIRRDEGGQFVLTMNLRVLPWCADELQSFFKKNIAYHSQFPDRLKQIKNPQTGDYFPEAVFLDKTGKALRFYFQDRWEEYLKSPEYDWYKERFEDTYGMAA